jgi:hypothetical protein
VPHSSRCSSAAASPSSGAGSAREGGAASPPGPLPWRQRDLRHVFPSFRDALKDGLPMSITQVHFPLLLAAAAGICCHCCIIRRSAA